MVIQLEGRDIEEDLSQIVCTKEEKNVIKRMDIRSLIKFITLLEVEWMDMRYFKYNY
jgi:hypothetical protein